MLLKSLLSEMSQYEIEYETSLTDPELEEPQLYEVLLLNDDYTTMPFVIEVLQRFFHKNYDEAEKLMYTVHEKGSAVCAIYPKEIAETRVQQVIDYARENGHPLMSTLRPH